MVAASSEDAGTPAPLPPATEPMAPLPPATEPMAPLPPATEPMAPLPPATEPMAPLPPATDPIATARRRHGITGAMLAAGMLGIDQVLGRKPREEAPIVVAASDQPVDLDHHGITVPVDEVTDVVAPPQPRPDPFARRPRRR